MLLNSKFWSRFLNDPNVSPDEQFELRSGSGTLKNSAGANETSWLVTNGKVCHPDGQTCLFGPEVKGVYIAGLSKGGSAPTLAAAQAQCATAADCGGVTEQPANRKPIHVHSSHPSI